MRPTKFSKLVERKGTSEKYKAGEIFHAHDFKERLYFINKGYVKRYQATKPDDKVIELIYGPGNIVSLTQLYKRLFGISQNQDGLIYVYQAMTDLEVKVINVSTTLDHLESDPELYKDFFYESGLKLRSNIARLASNAIKDDYKKIAHQLISLAYEFCELTAGSIAISVELPLPQSAEDIAEQLNISVDVAAAVLARMEQQKLIKIDGNKIAILNSELLKDIYLG